MSYQEVHFQVPLDTSISTNLNYKFELKNDGTEKLLVQTRVYNARKYCVSCKTQEPLHIILKNDAEYPFPNNRYSPGAVEVQAIHLECQSFPFHSFLT